MVNASELERCLCHTGYPFPYLYDESQEVAKAYKAACTPEFYVFAADTNQEYKLAYHGQFDSARPGNGKPVTGMPMLLACYLSCSENAECQD